jgi:putative flippase GtrA
MKMKSSSSRAKEMILYLIVGVLTTVVYYIVRFSVLKLSSNNMIAMLAAQIAAIVFAFFTNKYYVFNDKDNDQSLLVQFGKFTLGRLFVFIIDFLITLIFIQTYAGTFIHLLRFDHINYAKSIFSWPVVSVFIGNAKILNTFVWTSVSQVAAIIINYIISKFFVFKKEETINE